MDNREVYDRMLDAALGEPDADLEDLLASRPELSAEYERLRGVWADLLELPVHDVPEGARERVRASVLPDTGGIGRVPTFRSWVVKVAAALILFLAGVAAGRSAPDGVPALPTADRPSSATEDGKRRYVFLLRGDAGAAVADDLSRYSRDLWDIDRLVWAEVLHSANGIRVGEGVDAPVQRLFLVLAEDLDEAAFLAEQSPHLARGGSIEILPTQLEGQ